MKKTNLPLLKFKCDQKDCMFECFVNQNNNMLIHYNANMSALLDWPCPECGKGHLRYANTNTKFEFTLIKTERTQEQQAPQ
ncbi:MAG: hypothetical protein AB1486_21910 [Planctomycetota bacterium]